MGGLLLEQLAVAINTLVLSGHRLHIMASCNLYVLGLSLILVAVGYQYQNEIKSVLFGSNKEQPEASTKKESVRSDQPQKTPESDQVKDSEKMSSDSPFYNPPFDPENPTELYSKSGTKLITLNELAAHGHSGPLKPVWLGILGRVYDVNKGASHYYGPNGGYNFFSGRDGAKAFVTGQFDEEGLTDDVEDLTPMQLGEIDSWIQFYDKEYTFVGKLIGRYYNRDGSPTKAWYRYQKSLGEQAKIKAEQKALEKRYPGCNSRWSEKEGGFVSCSEKRYVCTMCGC